MQLSYLYGNSTGWNKQYPLMENIHEREAVTLSGILGFLYRKMILVLLMCFLWLKMWYVIHVVFCVCLIVELGKSILNRYSGLGRSLVWYYLWWVFILELLADINEFILCIEKRSINYSNWNIFDYL